jgi:outer membrane protein TolC
VIPSALGLGRKADAFLVSLLVTGLVVVWPGLCQAEQQAFVGEKAHTLGLLELDRVLDATLAHHPALKGEMQERVAADADLLSARGAFDPSIKGEGLSYTTGGYSGTYGGAYIEQPLEPRIRWVSTR